MRKKVSNRCQTCRTEMVILKGASFNFFLFVVLVFLGFLPGIIYYVIVKAFDHEVCLNCTGELLTDIAKEKKK